MKSILLKNVLVHNAIQNILIIGNKIAKIGSMPEQPASETLDCKGKLAAFPPFYNTHNHAAMTLLRGYGADVTLDDWLGKFIWPIENKMNAEDIYAGTRLAILEMIKSGTVFFNDMYWFPEAIVKAVEEMGIRACVGLLQICGPDGEILDRNRIGNQQLEAMPHSERIMLAVAPHAIYTVSEKRLREIAYETKNNNRIIHIHANETQAEVDNCMEQYGRRPIEMLDEFGCLSERTILAHAVHLNERERELIRERGCWLSHCPTSNLKLCSGMFNLDMVERVAGITKTTLGTDGAASNNNLSMLETMKIGSLVAKTSSDSVLSGTSSQMFEMATERGAKAFGLDAGVLAEGKLADVMLVKLDHPTMVADADLVSNLVYAADSSVIHSVICNGEFVMRDGIVPGEDEIIAEARERWRHLKSLI